MYGPPDSNHILFTETIQKYCAHKLELDVYFYQGMADELFAYELFSFF